MVVPHEPFLMVWIPSGGLQESYEILLWDGWRAEVSPLNGRQELSFYPPLWSAEARQDLSATSRHAVSMAELLGLSRDRVVTSTALTRVSSEPFERAHAPRRR
ncbi:DUF2625 family protein [Streptomyces sp. NPDC096538]|uniref:DUF2625 family protein n=1 Tax=Streptomyces sp. NPDC096538 TaxID=3155427 RepID=UPI003326276E